MASGAGTRPSAGTYIAFDQRPWLGSESEREEIDPSHTFHLNVVSLCNVQKIVPLCHLNRMLLAIFVDKRDVKSARQDKIISSVVIPQANGRPTPRLV
jgi:hypothetical protein